MAATSGSHRAPSGGQGDRPHRNRAAAEQAVETVGSHVRLPVVGDVTVPPVPHLAWYAGVGLLAALEIVDWPVALLLAAGKALADNRSNATVRQFGEALDDAG